MKLNTGCYTVHIFFVLIKFGPQKYIRECDPFCVELPPPCMSIFIHTKPKSPPVKACVSVTLLLLDRHKAPGGRKEVLKLDETCIYVVTLFPSLFKH
uniref:Uncharacterized protein n=1 Tax=Scophthalmus maximus TaxID=52904 RepID=A0A8D3BHL8_SCOMX